MKTEYVRVDQLSQSFSPRSEGEDLEHTGMLANIESRLPPIIVHRDTMRIIDGVHRLGAARLRGDELVEARMFEGTEHEAFVLGVKANISHGLPLSVKDRTSAAERIMAVQRSWSDRAIAEATGLSAKSVAAVRRRLEATGCWEDKVTARMGRDGRVRPLDNAEGRMKAVEFITARPDASLREIARYSGVSPSTARDVRNRLNRNEDPLPASQADRRSNRTREQGPASLREPGVQVPDSQLVSMLEGLKRDPALRFTESGRNLLRWVFAHAIRSDDLRDVVDAAPPHSSYLIAQVARGFAQEWLRLADRLDKQPRRSA